jgi:hypothetical protein
MNVFNRIARWPLLAVLIVGFAACDAEVKVATDSPGGDSSVVGDRAGDTDDVVTGGGLDDPGRNSNDGGATDDGAPPISDRDEAKNDPTKPPKQESTASRNMRVSSPQPGDLIASRTFTLRGECRTFENTGSYRLRAVNGTVLAEGHFTATGEMGKFSPYTTTVELKNAYTGAAVLEVFQFSAKDGSEIDKVILPLRVKTGGGGGGTNVSAFFTNIERNPGATDCSRVFPAKRSVASTAAIARAALVELLRGPSSDERRQNFGTEIPAGTRLLDITINNGVATADFSSELNRAAGSCSVTAARAQIEQTLRQFPTVRRVVISVEGNASAVLQP